MSTRVDTMREPGEEPESALPQSTVPARLCVWSYEIPLMAYPRKLEDPDKEPAWHVDMPKGAELQGVGKDPLRGALLFAWVNTGMAMERRYFYIVKTNHPLASPEKVCVRTGPGSEEIQHWPGAKLVAVPNGSWLGWNVWWHLFEVTP